MVTGTGAASMVTVAPGPAVRVAAYFPPSRYVSGKYTMPGTHGSGGDQRASG